MDELGNLLSEHRYTRTGLPGWLMVWASAAVGAGALGALLVGVFTKAAVVGLAVSAVGVAAALWSLRAVIRDEHLAVHEDGILRTTRFGSEVLRWDEVDYLLSLPRGEGWAHTVAFQGGRSAELRSTCYTDVDADIAEILRQKTQAVLWPRYLASIDEGGKVKLGAVTISRKLLSTDTHEISLRGLKSVVVEGPKVVFTDKSGTETRIDGQQPNAHLLLALVEHYRR